MRRARSSSFLFSPSSKRTFSHSTTSPSVTSTPRNQSVTSRTRMPSSSESRAATGFNDRAGSGSPSRGPEMGDDDDAGAGLGGQPDRRQGGADAAVVGDAAVGDRHIQILANQHAPPGQPHG